MTENRKPLIVYIENEPEMIVLAGFILNQQQFELIGALGGQQGLETVRQIKPDLVLLDLMMPDMDGWEVYQQLRADTTIEHIPVVIVTAKVDKIERTLGEIARVNGFVTKPFGPQELLDVINRALASPV